MHNYEKMYAILCGAVDDVIEELEHIPRARPFAHALSAALLEAEEIYLSESEDSAQVQKPVCPHGSHRFSAVNTSVHRHRSGPRPRALLSALRSGFDPGAPFSQAG